jgi:hypothetical protein
VVLKRPRHPCEGRDPGLQLEMLIKVLEAKLRVIPQALSLLPLDPGQQGFQPQALPGET